MGPPNRLPEYSEVTAGIPSGVSHDRPPPSGQKQLYENPVQPVFAEKDQLYENPVQLRQWAVEWAIRSLPDRAMTINMIRERADAILV